MTETEEKGFEVQLMEKQLKFVEGLFENLRKNMEEHIKIKKVDGGYCNKNYMNKDHGKFALKRKIIFLRQELLNLEKMIDAERGW